MFWRLVWTVISVAAIAVLISAVPSSDLSSASTATGGAASGPECPARAGEPLVVTAHPVTASPIPTAASAAASCRIVHISPTQTLYRAPTSRGFPVPYKAAAECAVREAYTLPAPAAYGPIPGLRSRRVRGALPADRPSAQARVASSLRPRLRRAPPLRSWRCVHMPAGTSGDLHHSSPRE